MVPRRAVRPAEQFVRACRFLLLAAFLGAAGKPVAARETVPEVTGLYVARENGTLTVSGALRNVFTAPVAERLAAGLPLIVKIRFELSRDVPLGPDKKLARITAVRTATWDRLRQEYLFSEDGPAGARQRATRDRGELQALVCDLKHVPILPTSRLKPGSHFYVRVQAQVQNEKPTLPIDRLLFFILPGWLLSDWATSGYFTTEPAP